MWPCNTADTKTLIPASERIRKKIGTCFFRNRVCQNDVCASIPYSIQHVVWCKIRLAAAVNSSLPCIQKYQRYLIMGPELVNFGRSYTMWPFNRRSAGNLTGSSNRWVERILSVKQTCRIKTCRYFRSLSIRPIPISKSNSQISCGFIRNYYFYPLNNYKFSLKIA